MSSIVDSSIGSAVLSDIYEDEDENVYGFVTVVKKSGRDGGVFEMTSKDVLIGR